MSLTASQSYQISSFIVICITELCWIFIDFWIQSISYIFKIFKKIKKISCCMYFFCLEQAKFKVHLGLNSWWCRTDFLGRIEGLIFGNFFSALALERTTLILRYPQVQILHAQVRKADIEWDCMIFLCFISSLIIFELSVICLWYKNFLQVFHLQYISIIQEFWVI
jgi:hypothetical protein